MTRSHVCSALPETTAVRLMISICAGTGSQQEVVDAENLCFEWHSTLMHSREARSSSKGSDACRTTSLTRCRMRWVWRLLAVRHLLRRIRSRMALARNKAGYVKRRPKAIVLNGQLIKATTMSQATGVQLMAASLQIL